MTSLVFFLVKFCMPTYAALRQTRTLKWSDPVTFMTVNHVTKSENFERKFSVLITFVNYVNYVTYLNNFYAKNVSRLDYNLIN